MMLKLNPEQLEKPKVLIQLKAGTIDDQGTPLVDIQLPARITGKDWSTPER